MSSSRLHRDLEWNGEAVRSGTRGGAGPSKHTVCHLIVMDALNEPV